MISFRSLLATRQPLVGTVISLPLPEIAEMAAMAGFDWLWLDMEHGLLDVADVQRAAMAASGLPCLARVPICDEAWIKRVLDTGVSGVIIPQVNTPEIAERAARATRYPPEGARSVGLGRGPGYGYAFASYVESANSQVSLIVQIEHIQAVENLEAILSVPGVDGVIVGPYDLSASMGKTGQLADPEVRATIEHIRATCQRRGFPIGIYAADVAFGQRSADAGFQFFALGSDMGALGSAWKDGLAAFKS